MQLLIRIIEEEDAFDADNDRPVLRFVYPEELQVSATVDSTNRVFNFFLLFVSETTIDRTERRTSERCRDREGDKGDDSLFGQNL